MMTDDFGLWFGIGTTLMFVGIIGAVVVVYYALSKLNELEKRVVELERRLK